MKRVIERYLDTKAAEATEPLRQFWLSFCDPDNPKGSQFLGAVIVEAQGVATAAARSHELGINPGGEVMIVQIPDGKRVPSDYCNRLLRKDEAETCPFELADQPST